MTAPTKNGVNVAFSPFVAEKERKRQRTSKMIPQLESISTEASSNRDDGSSDTEMNESEMDVDEGMEGIPSTAELCQQESDFILPRAKLPPNKEEFVRVEEFVAKAVEEHSGQGEATNEYKLLLQTTTANAMNERSMTYMVLFALRTAGNGNTLIQITSTLKHKKLIHQLLRFDPFDFEVPEETSKSEKSNDNYDISIYDMADALFHLFAALVSANTLYSSQILNSLWRILTDRKSDASHKKWFRVHAAIATVLRLVPGAKDRLFPVIKARSPRTHWEESEIVWNFKQTFWALRYVPAIRAKVIELTIETCVNMDVQIKVSDNGEASIVPELEEEANKVSGTQQAVSQSQPDNAAEADNGILDATANKLDSLMLMLFEYIESQQSSLELFQILLNIFESSILITHKSKFVQFLMFYAAGLESSANPDSDESFAHKFTSKLVNILVDPYRATTTRQAVACYLASFVSRASFVGADTVCETVSAFLRIAQAILTLTVDNPEAPVHVVSEETACSDYSLFYTVCQAAFYVMCFRGRDALGFHLDIMESEEDPETRVVYDISPTRWTQLCTHRTQPLRFCLESVRLEFFKFAEDNNLMETTVLQRLESQRPGAGRKKKRKKVAIRTAAILAKQRATGGVGGLGKEGQNPLDSYFPFDPYLLWKSHGYIEPMYKHWGDSAVEEDESEAEQDNTPDDMGEEKSTTMEEDNNPVDMVEEKPMIQSDAEAEPDKDLPKANTDAPSDDESDYGVPCEEEALNATRKRLRAFSVDKETW